jgi:hypothetical protein
MNRLTDKRLIIIAVLGIVLIGVLTVLFSAPPPAPPLSVRSIDSDGTMALSLWLEQSGYTVRQVLSDPIRFGEVDALFVLNPLYPYSDSEAVRIRDWVEQGNTLVVAGDYLFVVNGLLDAFDVSIRYLPSPVQTLSPVLPTLDTPPVTILQTAASYAIDTARDDIVTHVATDDDERILISFRQGEGTVWVSGMTQPFTNLGLQDEQNARLVLNFVSNLPEEAVIGFDEARHGFQEASSSLSGWLVSTSAGWSILVALVLTLVFLALRGRRFGVAVPIPEERLRREPVEYIQAMANLFRRSGQRDAMLKHYRAHLWRKLSERYAVDPRLSDDELVKTLTYRDAELDPALLRNLFGRLGRNKVSEQELLDTVRDVDDLLRKIS